MVMTRGIQLFPLHWLKLAFFWFTRGSVIQSNVNLGVHGQGSLNLTGSYNVIEGWFVSKKARILTRSTICGCVKSQEQEMIESSLLRQGRQLLKLHNKLRLQRNFILYLNRHPTFFLIMIYNIHYLFVLKRHHCFFVDLVT